MAPRAAAPARNVTQEMETLAGKLNHAARDLAEAVDGGLDGAREQRFAAGESHVYVQQLRAIPPRRLSQMIQDRYAAERPIRGRVDAYVRLFERLLDTVSQGAGGDKVAEACLAADSGKLYLLLAQASGRIPPQAS
jgi:hypothetical protein